MCLGVSDPSDSKMASSKMLRHPPRWSRGFCQLDWQNNWNTSVVHHHQPRGKCCLQVCMWHHVVHEKVLYSITTRPLNNDATIVCFIKCCVTMVCDENELEREYRHSNEIVTVDQVTWFFVVVAPPETNSQLKKTLETVVNWVHQYKRKHNQCNIQTVNSLQHVKITEVKHATRSNQTGANWFHQDDSLSLLKQTACVVADFIISPFPPFFLYLPYPSSHTKQDAMFFLVWGGWVIKCTIGKTLFHHFIA